MAPRVLPLPLVLLALFSAPTFPQSALGPPPAPPAQSDEMRRGVAHFDRAFYELTPHKRDLEASREFDLAIAEFERELTLRPAAAEAHRYLARIRMVRKEFRSAGEHYDALTALNPLDIDTYVLAALAYVEAGDVAAARARLVTATGQTSDPAVRARLAEYLAKLDARKP